MKVLDITNFYSDSGGGVRSYLRQKLRWLSHLETGDHVLIVPSERDQCHIFGSTRVHEVASPRVPGTTSYRWLARAGRVQALIRAEAPDVIELGCPYVVPLIVVPLARALGSACVAFFHADYPEAYLRPLGQKVSPGAGGLLAWLGDQHLRTLHNALDGTCVASLGKLDRLRGLGVERLHHTPLGVDLGLFSPSHRDPGLRRALDLPTDRPLALAVARLSPEKGIRELLAALERLPAPAPVSVVLVGDGPLRDEVAGRTAALPFVRVLPRVNDPAALARLYASADLFLAPGGQETFALAALEALASGQPVLGSHRGGVGELLAGSAAGLTVDTADPEAFARAILHLATAPRAPAVAAAQALASGYGWDQVFRRLRDVYAEARARRGAATLRPTPLRSAFPDLPVIEDDLAESAATGRPAGLDLAWALGGGER
jgi:alpha-1,6-mannosyltransferase